MTKTKAKRGRPTIPKKARLGRMFGARFRPDEERDVLRAIKASGKTHAGWVRETLLKAARAE